MTTTDATLVGRVVLWVDSNLGTMYAQAGHVSLYALKDHLGNVRATFTRTGTLESWTDHHLLVRMLYAAVTFLSLGLCWGCHETTTEEPKSMDPHCRDYNDRGIALLDSALRDTFHPELSALAIVYFDSAIQCAPDRMLYYDNRSRASARMGDRQGAIATMLAALEVFPNDPGLLFKTGIYFEAKGDFKIAGYYYAASEKNYDRLAKSYPDSLRIRIDRIGILPFTQGVGAAWDSLKAMEGSGDTASIELQTIRQWLDHFDRTAYVQQIGSN